jgi:hypothetical protein
VYAGATAVTVEMDAAADSTTETKELSCVGAIAEYVPDSD